MEILIVDDHPLFLDGLKSILASEWGSVKIHQATNVESALKIVHSEPLDCVLIDFKIPEMDGIDFLQALLARDITLVTAIISGESDPQIAKDALDLGARGFIPKSLKTEQLIEAIKTIINGEEFLTDTMKQQVERLNQREFGQLASEKKASSLTLTPRQLEVLKLIVKGYSNKQIANIMHLSTNTVKEHLHNIFRNLQVSNRSQCIIQAQKLGLEIGAETKA